MLVLLVLQLLLLPLLLEHSHHMFLEPHHRALAHGGVYWKIRVQVSAARCRQSGLGPCHTLYSCWRLFMLVPTELTTCPSSTVPIKEVAAYYVTGVNTFLMEHEIISSCEHLLTNIA